jgi:hypothetical protein
MFRISKNWLFQYVFAKALAYTGSITGQDNSVSGALVEDGDDLGQVSLYCIFHRRFLKAEVL